MLGVEPKAAHSQPSSFGIGAGLGFGVIKHFTQALGIQSRLAVNFFAMSTYYDYEMTDYNNGDDSEIPSETGMDLSLDATAIVGPFGPFFLESGLVVSYREYFRDKALEDEDDEYTWDWIAPLPDGFAVGAVMGGGLMIGDTSQYIFGARCFIRPFETSQLITLIGYFAIAFGSTGEAPPQKPYRR
jgi:hypothetical protein